MRSLLITICLLYLIVIPIVTDDPANIIRGRIYQGRYQAIQPGPTFDFLQGKEGIIKVIFYDNTDGDVINSVDIIIRDPKYSDSKVISLTIDQIVRFNGNDYWNDYFHSISYMKLDKKFIWSSENMFDVQTQIKLTNLDSEDYEAVGVSVHMKGDIFQFTAELEHIDNVWQTIGYCLYTTLIAVVQFYSAYRLSIMLDAPNFVAAGRMSLLTISCCAILDMTHGFELTQYIFGPYVNQAFYFQNIFFIIPGGIYIASYVLFNMRLVLFVWRSQNLHLAGQLRVLKRKMLIFYTIYTLGLIAYMISMYFISCFEWYIILSQLLLVPQIIKNVYKGHKITFNKWYILGFVGIRMLLPIYERACPQNLFALTPNSTLVMILLIIFVVEVGLVYLQARFGSRFFVPNKLKPNFYDYKFQLILSEQTKDKDCSVCLLNLFEVGAEQYVNQSNLGDNLLEPPLKQKVIVSKTPCNHYFHHECLNEWMEVKLQCPTCRRQLPPG